MQRMKGKRGEREVARIMRETWPVYADDIHRGNQTRAGTDDADVEGHPLLWPESKLGKRPNIHKAMQQAEADTDGRMPIVFTRRDREQWLVTMRPETLKALLDEAATVGDG